MFSLSDVCGLPVSYDEERHRFIFGEDVFYSKFKQVPLADLVPTLLNKSLKYPEFVYSCHESLVKKEHRDNGKWNENLRYDMYVLPYGLLGIEYIKTHIYYSEPSGQKFACVVEVVFGELTIILQKNQDKAEFDFDTHVDEAMILKTSKGKKVFIPTGYMFTFVNTTNYAVVFSVLKTTDQLIDYRKISKEQGLAYFFIAKNARTEVVTNPRYRTAPNVKECTELKINFPIKLPRIEEPLYDIAINAAQDLLNILC